MKNKLYLSKETYKQRISDIKNKTEYQREYLSKVFYKYQFLIILTILLSYRDNEKVEFAYLDAFI